MRNKNLHSFLKILDKTISTIFDLISKIHYLVSKIRNEKHKKIQPSEN